MSEIVNLSSQAVPAEAVAPQQEKTPNTDPTTQQASSPDSQKQDDLSPKFAALAKRERYNRMLIQKAKAREAELMKREQAIQARERAWDEEFRSSPLEALKKRNLTYQDITNAALNDGKFQPDVEIKEVRDEIQRLRQENEEKERKALEAQTRAQAQAEAEVVDAFKDNISKHIEQNTEKYELTKLYDGADLVFQTVEEYYGRTQKVLSIDEACSLVEQYLENELERTSKESKKFQSKFLAQKQVDEKKSDAKSSVTLNNSMQSSSAPSFLPQKTEDDRIKRALAALGQ